MRRHIKILSAVWLVCASLAGCATAPEPRNAEPTTRTLTGRVLSIAPVSYFMGDGVHITSDVAESANSIRVEPVDAPGTAIVVISTDLECPKTVDQTYVMTLAQEVTLLQADDDQRSNWRVVNCQVAGT